MYRTVVLGISDRKAIRAAVTGGLGRKVALRFVAGEEIDDALKAIRGINATGALASIDYLGENITDLTQAKAAVGTYLTLLDRIRADDLKANISVKVTQLGLDVEAAESLANASTLVAHAAEVGTSVTLDMEDHRYTDRTIETCLELQSRYPGSVGIAVQAYLFRTPADLEVLIDAGVHVRLCKGAYKEPRAIAHRSRDDVDAAFRRLATRLMNSSAYAMIATHDERLVEHALAEARTAGRAPDSYEVQMLFGVRRELQKTLVTRGDKLRVYVPFGEQWYPYLMRRIAERPANVRFLAESLLRK